MNALRSYCVRVLTPLALMLAMGLSGFAHANARAALSPDLAAYLAAGGALSDICGSAPSSEVNTPECDTCRLLAAAIMPLVADGPALLVPYASAPRASAPRLTLPLDPPEYQRQSRAPPFA